MTYVKICGLTTLIDAQLAVDAGADYLGFIFYEKSPRCVTIEQVQAIISGLHKPAQVRSVGVFVDATAAVIDTARTACQLDLIQLHGQESRTFVQAVPSAYKAIRPANYADWKSLAAQYLPTESEDTRLPTLLIDAYHPTQHGGTGLSVDREIALDARRQTPRLMLAGGLTAENVSEAVRIIQPFAVDVSSGVESVPRLKDPVKIRAFVRAVRTIHGKE